jgi:AcrR family transcriptional regulator
MSMATRTKRLTRDERREVTRTKLLAAAETLFTKHGFAGTSVEEIAEAAGFTRGAFYSNFEDKDDIFLSLLDHKLHRRIGELNEVFKQTASLGEAFNAIIEGNQRRKIGSETILNTEFWLYAARNPKARRRLAEIQRTERQAFERAIRAQFEAAGLEVPFDVHDAALLVMMVDLGAPRLALIDPEDVGSDFFFRGMLQLFEAGVALAEKHAKS